MYIILSGNDSSGVTFWYLHGYSGVSLLFLAVQSNIVVFVYPFYNFFLINTYLSMSLFYEILVADINSFSTPQEHMVGGHTCSSLCRSLLLQTQSCNLDAFLRFVLFSTGNRLGQLSVYVL